MADRLRVGVIGTGFGATVQVPGFQACPRTEVVAICSARLERAQEAAVRLGVPHALNDYRRLLDLPEVDAVSVATPPYLHHAMAVAAIEAGKHVLCEKPLALNLAEAREMADMAQKAGLCHMVDHEFRFVPARAYFKELVDQGYIGRPLFVQASLLFYSRRFVERAFNWWSEQDKGGGLLGAMGSHIIDAVRHWFGDFAGLYGQVETHVPERLLPGTSTRQRVTSDDAFALTFRLVSGALGVMTASSMARRGRGAVFEAYGSEGTLSLGADNRLKGCQGEAEMADLPVPERFQGADLSVDDHLKPFVLLAERFAAGSLDGEEVSPSFHDGAKVQEVMDAVAIAQKQKRWLDLPLT